MARLNPDDVDITHMRSFLDLATRRRGWRKTRKGSGKALVDWTTHQYNHTSDDLAQLKYGPGNKSKKEDRFMLFFAFALDEAASRHTTEEAVLRVIYITHKNNRMTHLT